MNMSNAAYNRGTQVIRRQTDQQVNDALPGIEARHERETARETIAALRQQLEASRAEHIATAERLAAALDAERQQNAVTAAQLAHTQHKYQTIRAAYRREYQTSQRRGAMLHTLRLMHPEKYADIRMNAEELHPAAFKPYPD